MEKFTDNKNNNVVQPDAMDFQTWQSIKSKYSNAIVLLRIEERYFAFDNDAFILSSITGIESASCEVAKMQCCFPAYQLDNYLHKLVNAGNRVAICDQLGSMP